MPDRSASWIRIVRISAAVAVVAAGVGCRSEPPARTEGHFDSGPRVGLNDFVAASAAAVTGTVVNLSKPRWNSVDGKQWEEDPRSTEMQGVPMLVRLATVRVREVVYDSDALKVTPGQEVEVYLLGSGEDAELGPHSDHFDRISGPVSKGDEVLWILARREVVEHQSTPTPRITLMGHSDGSWRIEGNMAVNVVGARSAPLGPLKERLRAARAEGPRPGDRRGAVNPLQ